MIRLDNRLALDRILSNAIATKSVDSKSNSEVENMGAAAAQRREYGWLLVAERLPFFSVSDLLL